MEKTAVLSEIPDMINADLMTITELYAKLQKGYDELEAGKIQEASSSFAEFREKHQKTYCKG